MARNSPINTVIDERKADDGTTTPVTVADRITELVRTGQFVELAAAAVGVHKETLYEWLRVAARARIEAKGRSLDDLDLTDHQRHCIAFSDAVLQAAAQWAARANIDLDRLSRGGIPVVKTQVTEKFAVDATGTERLVFRVRHTTTETTLPDAKVLMWRLERRFQPYFGHKVEVALGGAEASPPLDDEEISESLADALEAWLASRHGDEVPVGSVAEQVEEATQKVARKRVRDDRGHAVEVIDVPSSNGDGE